MSRFLLSIRILGMLVLIAISQGCARKDTPAATRVEKPLDPNKLNKSEPLPPASEPLPPATMQDVKAALQRTFGDNVVISSRYKPVFIVGDFNGDEYEDLAVMVEPVPAKLADVNSELANWTIQDADKYFLSPAKGSVAKPPQMHRPQIEKGETVLAIIHGFGKRAWQSPEARQTYLVKHAAAVFLGISKSSQEKAIQALKLPITTDVIKANRDSKRGILFWTGSNYAWKPNNG